jgi:hypothetical protein
MLKLFSILTVIVLFGCKKSDTMAPVITVTSPMENQVFPGGTTVMIKASITDDNSIHMVHVIVLDKLTDGHVVHSEEHTDSQSYEVNQSFLAIAGRSYSIEIEATDHGDNVSSKELTISAN